MRDRSAWSRASYSFSGSAPESRAPTNRSRSAPAEKLPPAPVTMATRNSGSASSSSHRSARRTSISGLKGFFFSGRLRVISRMAPRRSERTAGTAVESDTASDSTTPQQHPRHGDGPTDHRTTAGGDEPARGAEPQRSGVFEMGEVAPGIGDLVGVIQVAGKRIAPVHRLVTDGTRASFGHPTPRTGLTASQGRRPLPTTLRSISHYSEC